MIIRYPTMSPCQVTDPVLEPGQRLLGDAAPRLLLVRDREAKERALPWPGDGTLLRVDLKFEASLDEASQARHHAQSGLLAADIDVAIIRITHKPVPTTLKLAIQLIQHEVRQQRRERTTLRRPLLAGFEQPVRQHASGQVASHQSKHSPVGDARRHASHQPVVIDPVEELRQRTLGSWRTVMPSTPGAPLFRTTARNAASMFSGSQIASISSVVRAGLSGSDLAVTTSTSRASGREASPRSGIGKSSISWIGGRGVIMRRPSYLPSPSTPSRGPFGPSATEVAYYALC